MYTQHIADKAVLINYTDEWLINLLCIYFLGLLCAKNISLRFDSYIIVLTVDCFIFEHYLLNLLKLMNNESHVLV